MGDWGSYGLSDFLMFSAPAYWRLVERYHAAWWPAQALAVVCGVAAVAVAGRTPRAVLLLLAAAWAWIGWAFFWRSYAEIFLGAPAVAIACGAQALLLGVAAAIAGRGPSSRHRAGLALAAAAVLFYPLLGGAEGRPWRQAEVFGFMPDPTALATLGFLLAMNLPLWQRLLLAVIPALTLSLGLLTRFAL